MAKGNGRFAGGEPLNRLHGLFDPITDFGNLYRAYLRARRGKRDRPAVERFTLDLEPELLRLQAEVRDGSYRPGPFVTFVIEDPKPRLIHAAPFRDRVLHHAVIAVLESHFDRWLDFDSYACRKGKGLDAALRRAVALSRRWPWILRSDIRKCFESIDHTVLKGILARKIKDKFLLRLLETIIDHGGEGGRGLPIGNLTSQWFANLYLGQLDAHIRQTVRPGAYLRYMDDFSLFLPDREEAKSARKSIALWAADHLRLQLKQSATAIYRCRSGWPFLGFRVLPDGLDLRRGTWQRFRNGLGRVYHQFDRGRLSAEDLVQSVACRIAHLERGRTRGLRRKEMRIVEL